MSLLLCHWPFSLPVCLNVVSPQPHYPPLCPSLLCLFLPLYFSTASMFPSLCPSCHPLPCCSPFFSSSLLLSAPFLSVSLFLLPFHTFCSLWPSLLTSLSKAADLDHHWVAKAWLNDIGLAQYSQAFQNHLVDGRMLNSLMKRDLEKHLNVSKKFHQVSILLGIELLYQVNFSREVRTGVRGPLPQPCFPLWHLLSLHPTICPSVHPSV